LKVQIHLLQDFSMMKWKKEKMSLTFFNLD
jgi:hypothetical protein